MSQAAPKSRSRSSSPVPKSRSRSASPVRKVKSEPEVPVDNTPNSVKPLLFPKLEDYIAKSLGDQFKNLVAWNNWQMRAEDFMATYCPDKWLKGEFSDAALAYMFSIHSLVHHYGSHEVQAIVNQFCLNMGYTSSGGRAFLEEVERINLSRPKSSRPNSIHWARGWSRMIRHMNQGIPLIQFFPTGKSMPFYHSVFKDPDCYSAYVVPESLSFRAVKKEGLVDQICTDATSVTAAMLQEEPNNSHLQILDDVFLWNSHLFFGNGFTLTEDVLRGTKDNSLLMSIQAELAGEEDKFEVKQVIATRISLKEGVKL